jgi:crotonobetainyl-CoA hydratase
MSEGREEAVTRQRLDGIALITLNRPRSLNAVNAALSAGLGDALEQLETDPELRVGIITGAGRAFCAGADLKAAEAGESVTAPEHPEWGFAGLVEHRITKPLIAAVNGLAVGGGAEVVLACDLAVMAETAVLGFPEVARGLMANAGGLIALPRQLPLKVAMEMALTGQSISATEAARWGLVNRVVASDSVLAEALTLARLIAGNAPLAVQASKRIMRQATGSGSGWDREVWNAQDEESAALLRSADAAEGIAAFTNKRPTLWSGG